MSNRNNALLKKAHLDRVVQYLLFKTQKSIRSHPIINSVHDRKANSSTPTTSSLNQFLGKPLGLADERAVTSAAALNHIE
jgi:hypothetical protein